MENNRLQQQIHFIVAIDQLKTVIRQSYLVTGERKENTAEHSWHVAVAAMLLCEYANEPVDRSRVVQMLLLHDIVEILAGDTYLYDSAGLSDQSAREQEAAQKLFGLLPADQSQEFHQLWEEFESKSSPEARFAKSLDRLIPLLHNYENHGKSWLEHGIQPEMVLERTHSIAEGSTRLWELAQQIIQDSAQKGYLKPAPGA